MKHQAFLLVNARGDMRVIKRLAAMQPDEVAYKVTVDVPASWQTVVGNIDITMPEPPSEVTLTSLLELRNRLKEAK